MTRATRASVHAAAAATANSKRLSGLVTPSPKRKKIKSNVSSCTYNSTSSSRCNRKIAFPSSPLSTGSDNNPLCREDIQKLVFSCIGIDDDDYDTVVISPQNRSNNINTNTLGGWCLIDGLTHCASVSGGILAPAIKKYGPPSFYIDHLQKINKISSVDGGSGGDEDPNCSVYVSSDYSSTLNSKDKYRSFRDLCRIVSGQQLAGAAAKTIYSRLLSVVGGSGGGAEKDDDDNNTMSTLTPEGILSIIREGDMETDLRAPAGLSKAKCNCIVEIARNFQNGTLSDEFLLGNDENSSNSANNNDDEIRSRLLDIKGLGPWSVDMFLLFQCHRSNILPIGDLAVRNGTSKLWNVKGSAKKGGLCQKKDADKIKDLHEPFAPYRSISSYYMYKCLDMKG
ncbi:MAG: 3-methyladenine DNA glycosylase/8-oxoguanine DNA glycosylase [Bacillariaceae sp.]|jgi:3-methyladenine DNA glycosylase/8-oxoguanine DNA glycosylase